MDSQNRFYVYEHWRPDKDVCFWVGKGNGDRAFRFRRNFHYNNVVAKLGRLGMCVEVRMVASGLSEDTSLALEIERIAFWRSSGVALTNVTNGGEGTSGLKHSEKTRALLSLKLRGKKRGPLSEATRVKIGLAQKGKKRGKNPAHSARLKGRSLTAQHRAAISEGNTGRIVAPETRAKIGNRHRGRIHTDATKQKFSNAHLGVRPKAETLAKMSAAQKQKWKDPVVRAKRLAYRDDPERRANWIESLRSKPDFSDEHRRKLSEAAKADWARRKAIEAGASE